MIPVTADATAGNASSGTLGMPTGDAQTHPQQRGRRMPGQGSTGNALRQQRKQIDEQADKFSEQLTAPLTDEQIADGYLTVLNEKVSATSILQQSPEGQNFYNNWGTSYFMWREGVFQSAKEFATEQLKMTDDPKIIQYADQQAAMITREWIAAGNDVPTIIIGPRTAVAYHPGKTFSLSGT